MRRIALLALAISSLALHAQNSGQTIETTRVSAQLTSKVNSKNAKVGDPVFAKTTSVTRLYDGTRLPQGTRLVGKITEVHAKSSDDKTAHLAFSLNRAILRDGSEVPVHATLAALAPPAPMASPGGADTMATSEMAGSGRAAGGMTGGNVRGATSATNPLGTGGGTIQNASEAELQGVRPVAADVGSTIYSTTALQLNHVPIAGMPGITLTSSAGATSAGALDASGHDISLESGTRLTLNISTAPQ